MQENVPIIIQADQFLQYMPAFRNLDAPLHMYYDETNNPRRLSLSEVGLNAPSDQIFTIAGIALKPGQSIEDWDRLRKVMRIQASATEVKFKHLAPSGYEGALASSKLSNFLSWLLDSDCLVHYSLLDVLHWSTLDIIDALMVDRRLLIIPFHVELKNELYHAVSVDPSAFMRLLHSFAFPNVDPGIVEEFLLSVLCFIDQNVPEDRNFKATMLRQTLRHAARLPELNLAFLHDNKPGELISDFSSHFMRCVYLFKHASHTFDRETYVESVMQSYEILDGTRRLDYRFIDSRDEIGIQVSDVVAGLLGRHFTYVRNHALPELRAKKASFTALQKKNLDLLRMLIDKSDAFSEGLCDSVLPLDTSLKNNAFLHDQEAPDYLG